MQFVKLTLPNFGFNFKSCKMKMTKHTYYFSPGPATLPNVVKEQIHQELLDTFGIGVSIMEISHRSQQYGSLNAETLELCRSVFDVPKTHSVLLSVCGAQQHFSLIPQHLTAVGDTVAYTKTGNWAQMACEEAQNIGRNFCLVYDGGPVFQTLGNPKDWIVPPDAKYIHLTVNNTVCGTEYAAIPTFDHIPLVLDMTSALGARTDIPWPQTGLVYAAAQKHFGIAGVSVIIIRNDILEKSRYLAKQNHVGTALSYGSIYNAKSILNTPPVFAIFVMNRMLRWIKKEGGIVEMTQRAREKARLIYTALDAEIGFYQGYANKADRSRHNFVFKLKSKSEDSHFIQEAAKQDIIGIQGYHTTGGIRASLYNGSDVDSAKVFADFMNFYRKKFG